MAEPAGILLELSMDNASLLSAFRRKVTIGDETRTLAHQLCALLDAGEDGDVLIVHHSNGVLFFAWMMVHYDDAAVSEAWPLIDALAARSSSAGPGPDGAISTTFPHELASLHLRGGRIERDRPACTPERLEALNNRLWSFARKEQFADPAGLMRQRGTQCKPFKSAWKRYLQWRDEQEKPQRIAQATAEAPFCLFDKIYVADGMVFERDSYTGRDIVIPQADPLTLRRVSGYLADKAHVWNRTLAPGSPPRNADGRNNRAALWQYEFLPGANGGTFNWIFDRWDTVYWSDHVRIYAEARNPDDVRVLSPLEFLKAGEFREFGHCFATDGTHVLFCISRLDLDPVALQTEEFLIWDQTHVYHRDVRQPLDGSRFEILERIPVRGHGIPLGWDGIHEFMVTDGSKTGKIDHKGHFHPQEVP